ncbi:SDR family NAD(P)-dependent oxidoreductase [Bacteroidales bacterium OttesenSCG-928-K03]|nr:SDR family NAD(P)-dependent oxidoreductase [Odoribacter sp. OttesenSCG-928-L07]MDL2241012.1 SDR family NAD(P)-dependent oxidoreductase [Bacteroidales bacterium OttesenSCG-928-K22]MDL2242197.1 SDR family NAD(P)-dependent oxidoreductase [Bacteroidales bacterium OttesenSCG-928-K03]
MYQERDRKNKTALVTGAVSGIGLAFADNLAKQGYDLMIVDIQEEKIIETSIELKEKYNVNVNYFTLDLSKNDAAERVYEFCINKGIDVHILISNAGMFAFDSITDIPSAKYDAMLYLHMNTPAKLCRLFGKDMKERNEGYILTVSSLSAWMPYPYLSVYSATKRFLRTFSRAIHFEFSSYNVGVTTICPGAVDTDLLNLPPKIHNLAKKLGVMISSDKLAKKSLKRMFNKRVTYIPGLINKIALPILMVLPVRFVGFVMRRVMR